MGTTTGGARRQGVLWLALGALCAVVALVARPGDQTGLLALGVGLLAGSAAWPWRGLLPGTTVTPFAVVNVLLALGRLPGGYLYGAYILAAAVAFGAATLAARRGMVGAHPWTPTLLAAVIGALLLGTALPGAGPASFYGWFVSWWMPAVALALLGAARLIARGKVAA